MARAKPSNGLVPSDFDALQSLLRRAIPYEKAGAVIPRDLLQFGFYGSIIVIATGLLALIFPGATSIRHSSFFLVLGGPTASLDSLMRAAAVPAIILGVILLGLDVYLMRFRTSERWRSAVIVQAAAGGVGGVFCTVFLALVVLNLAIWLAIVALALMLIGMILGAMGS